MIKITIFHQILLLQFIDMQKWAIEPKSTPENDHIHTAKNCTAMNSRILFWFKMIKITIFHQILLLQFIDMQKWAIEPKSTPESDHIHLTQELHSYEFQNTLLVPK